MKTPADAPSPAAFGSRERFVQILFRLYKGLFSPVLHAFSPAGRAGGGCRYQPTCSEYAALACAQHGWVRGGFLAAWRVLRCNPLARTGWDPVPSRSQVKPSAFSLK